MPQLDLILSPSDFVALANQTLEFALGIVTIEGELSNLRISRNQWLYFDVIDENSKVSFFGTIYNLPGPLENGMTIKVSGRPHIHNKFGFNINVLTITPSGEGTIKKLLDALKNKLEAEGLFDQSRKRGIKCPPMKIGLLASIQSAAYADFMKIVKNRWPFLSIEVADILVQGANAPEEIVNAIQFFNERDSDVEVLVIIRGGGAEDDLNAFNDERVVRKIASSRIPTLVAIGHEINTTLGELASDLRGSTPSNAAELLVPDYKQEIKYLRQLETLLSEYLRRPIVREEGSIISTRTLLINKLKQIQNTEQLKAQNFKERIKAYNPDMVLRRGYNYMKLHGRIVDDPTLLKEGDNIQIITQSRRVDATITKSNNSNS